MICDEAVKHPMEEVVDIINKYCSLITSCQEAIVSLNLDNQITLWNPAAEKMFGYTVEEAVGQNISELIIPPHLRQQHLQGMNRIKTSQPPQAQLQKTFTLEAKHKNGHLVPIEMSLFQFKVEHNQAFIAVIRTIDPHSNTDPPKTPEKATNPTLPQTSLQFPFVVWMSHEFKTPLNAIIGYSELLEKSVNDSLSEKQQRYAHNINISSHYLLEMVNEILDSAKAQAGQVVLSPEWVELSPLLENLNCILHEIANQHAVQLIFNVEDGIDGIEADPLRLRQILFNLISNAIKFNRQGGQVTVKLFKSKTTPCICWQVEDTGIGIPKDKLDKIFTPFYQIKNFNHQQNGTGLGLPLTKYLIELHGGKILVESEINKGTTFTVHLPVKMRKT